jgi:hypothetical protein
MKYVLCCHCLQQIFVHMVICLESCISIGYDYLNSSYQGRVIDASEVIAVIPHVVPDRRNATIRRIITIFVTCGSKSALLCRGNDVTFLCLLAGGER